MSNKNNELLYSESFNKLPLPNIAKVGAVLKRRHHITNDDTNVDMKMNIDVIKPHRAVNKPCHACMSDLTLLENMEDVIMIPSVDLNLNKEFHMIQANLEMESTDVVSSPLITQANTDLGVTSIIQNFSLIKISAPTL
jgi:hypothetical protein